ncbi:MAG: hypothetical protein ACLFTK_10965 [Anaerolineales bacterium]
MSDVSVWRVVLKAGALFLILNIVYAVARPLDTIWDMGLYNTPLVPGRERLPYAENPAESYSLTVTDPEAMFATHELAAADDESAYRVFLLGDSGIWGWLLGPDETLSACINRGYYHTASGQPIRVYNLGYPLLNLTKDLVILDTALRYEPDMVVWFVTLASFFADDQLTRPFIQANAQTVRRLNAQFDIGLNTDQLSDNTDVPFERTIIGQRRQLADWLRLQAYGLAWAATGIDHRNPEFFTPVRHNLRAATDYEGFERDIRAEGAVLWSLLDAGTAMARGQDAEMLIINEPIYRSSGLNSDLRYNFYYPREGYDWYRTALATRAQDAAWQYADLWDAMPPDAFTDSALHLTPSATCALAEQVAAVIQQHAP